MTPEQIAASLRSIPYGVGNKAADLIEQQVSELEALRAERDAASERRKAEVISLQKACRALKTQVKGLNRKLVKVQGAEGNFSERADMMLRIEYQRKELATLREEREVWVKNDVARDADFSTLRAKVAELETGKDGAYLERNKLVALLAAIFPSGIKRTAIEGWSDDWHGCVYIDFPWGQASWHYHDSQAALFDFLPPYTGDWNGHTTDEKYDALVLASRSLALLKGGA